MDYLLWVPAERRLHGKPLGVDVGHVESSTLGREIADNRLVYSGPIHEQRPLGATVGGQVGDHAAVDEIAIELEGTPRFHGLDHIGAILDAPGGQLGGLAGQHILSLIILGNRSTPAKIGSRLAPKGRLITVEVQRLLILAKVG